MAKPQTLVLTGYGINCDEETKFAFDIAGAHAEIVHINDLIDGHKKLEDYQILAFPGGFSYGDDTGSGNALANKIRNHCWDEMLSFVEKDKLAIGICNGFQVMANLGLLPALDNTYGERKIALMHNASARYSCRWVDLSFEKKTPWTKGIGKLSLPIAHGEGRFFAEEETMFQLQDAVIARYCSDQVCHYLDLPLNPNGSLANIAGIADPTGRIIGMMPHPERAIAFTQLPHWTFLKELYKRSNQPVPSEGPGLKLFKNAVEYFK